jgi:hypothetical protein
VKYATALVLMILACVFLVAGFVSKAATAFALAAVCSLIALVLLVRRARSKKIKSFVTNPPPRVEPSWKLDTHIAHESEEFPEELEIDQVIDNYRRLVAAEILPALETLSTDELRKVVAVEQHGRNRQAVIRRAEVLIDLTERKRGVAEAIVDPEAPRRSTTKTRTKSAGTDLTI